MTNKLSIAASAGLFVVLPLGMAAPGGSTGDLEDALVHCDAEALSEALDMGASADWAHPESGASALHYAVECESEMTGTQFPLVRLLVDAGAAVSADNSNGESVLERAMLFGSEPTIALLLDSGADPNALAATDVSMLALARIVGNASAEQALRRYGAELLDSDLEAIEEWGRFADFGRSLDEWMERNPDADGEEYVEAHMRILRRYFGDQPELADALDQIERNPTAYQKDGYAYASCVEACGGGWAGVACRITCPPE